QRCTSARCLRRRSSRQFRTAPANRRGGGRRRDGRVQTTISIGGSWPMSLVLHYHPLASFCWKALIALHENDVPVTPKIVDLRNAADRAALIELWPIGKFPVLRDESRDTTVPESSIIIEYLDLHYPGPTRFIPSSHDRALQTRLRERFFDLYVHLPMQ